MWFDIFNWSKQWRELRKLPPSLYHIEKFRQLTAYTDGDSVADDGRVLTFKMAKKENWKSCFEKAPKAASHKRPAMPILRSQTLNSTEKNSMRPAAHVFCKRHICIEKGLWLRPLAQRKGHSAYGCALQSKRPIILLSQRQNSRSTCLKAPAEADVEVEKQLVIFLLVKNPWKLQHQG